MPAQALSECQGAWRGHPLVVTMTEVPPALAIAAPVRLAESVLRDVALAVQHEWLVTNGLGGYASGTVLGLDTRRYHGLLVAALPPARRTLLLARLHEELAAGDARASLAAAEFHDGTIAPDGYRWLAGFELVGTLPRWRYKWAGYELEKLVWMEHGANVTFVRYRLAEGDRPLELGLRVFVAHRDHHGHTHGHPDWHAALEVDGDRCVVRLSPDATPLTLRLAGACFVEERFWYWRFLHRVERARGLDAEEDLYTPGRYVVTLEPGQSVTLVASAGSAPYEDDPDAALARTWERQAALVERLGAGADAVVRRLALAADQFLVGEPNRRASAIIAGYHWFGAWGRDTLIALPGLCLTTRRWNEAREMLLACARRVQRGLVPAYIADDGTAVYTAADTALWLAEALAQYERVTSDTTLVDALLPTLSDIVAWYRRGTDHGIGVAADGLLAAGAPGLALTWMDARVGSWVVTPRRGKPIELQALWYNTLRLVIGWRLARGQPCPDLSAAAERCRRAFAERFWYAHGGYCFDVVDGEDGDDASLRPNQLLTLALTHPLLEGERAAAMLAAVERALLTPYGLRTLTPEHPAYRGRYGGDVATRDGAYHQGTVWPWLLEPYAAAARRVYGSGWLARPLLARLVGHLSEAGLGSVSELFCGDPPHEPGGAIAQAWSVAALLRLWLDL